MSGDRQTTLLRQIQLDATESKESVAVVLRRAQVLAARLHHEPLKNWVEWELNGYPSADVLPGYRVLGNVHVIGDFSGPFGSGMQNAPIAPVSVPEDMHDVLFGHKFFEPIAELEGLARASGPLEVNWPTNAVALYGQHMYESMVCRSARKVFSSQTVTGIVDVVRNRILAFALEIESEAPDAGEAAPGEEPLPQERVSQIVNTTIYGGQNTVATGGADVVQRPVQNQVNNWGHIAIELGELGLPQDEIAALQAAVARDNGVLGGETRHWLDQLGEKIANGSVMLAQGVTVGVVSDLLVQSFGLG